MPLAHDLRPKTLEDVIGQNHLLGKDGFITAMIKKNTLLSMILYGNPGTGKTTIANLLKDIFKIDAYTFNASTDSKQVLKDIIDTTMYQNIILMIDEIHRMKKDIQDYLLPFIENGKVILIGLTTENPYHAINQAVRSRVHLLEVRRPTDEDIKGVLQKALKHLDNDIKASDEALLYIAQMSHHDVRYALNLLERSCLQLEDGMNLSLTTIKQNILLTNKDLDKNQNFYYELLSALQKSIRGSDVDASIHYLARLLTLGDLDSIIRRLLVITYEDIGLANPQMGPKVLAACEACIKVGMPEARIIFSNIVIELALSPKSNSAYLAIDEALSDYEKFDTGILPDHVNNQKIKQNPNLYHYPHNDLNGINAQTYLPDKIKHKRYLKLKKSSAYEEALEVRLNLIDKIKHIKR